MNYESELSYDHERFPHSVMVSQNSMLAMYRAGRRINDQSHTSLFKRGYSALTSLVDIYADGKDIIANTPGGVVAESIKSRVLEAARVGAPDEHWIRGVSSRNIYGEMFAYDDDVDKFIQYVKDVTGIEYQEVLTAHAFTILDWITYKIENRNAIGALDSEKGRVGIIKVGFMNYRISQDEIEESLSHIIDTVPVILSDPL